MVKSILVPVDGSDSAIRAVKIASDLAMSCQAKLTFLYVANINQLAINACLTDAILDSVNKAGDAVLNQVMAEVPEGVEVESVSQTGSPAVVILDYLEDYPIDLVVMGTRGLGVVKGVLMGSVSQYVVEQAKCPVMVVK